ncbi:hypothetical protein [Cystobacter fuscus]|uniref:hypothetical protein n=1 Tax=Cystobacter fuscus TaxID=43 RepID=UPI0012DD12E6|nr:hypothetical protein [Cystobacter fuscus]
MTPEARALVDATWDALDEGTRAGGGMALRPGMILAGEPMVNQATSEGAVLDE